MAQHAQAPLTSRYFGLAQLIRTQREQLKLGVRDTAQQANISAAMLSRIETYGASAKTSTLISLAKVLQLDSDLLLLLGCKLPPDIEELIFSGTIQPRLQLLKQLRQDLKQL